VPLLRRAVRLVAGPGSIVCDPFAGIASTGLATLEENCRFIGGEIDSRHAAVGRKRLEQHAPTNQGS
jgi:adenine-specific DNA-methyltransferase